MFANKNFLLTNFITLLVTSAIWVGYYKLVLEPRSSAASAKELSTLEIASHAGFIQLLDTRTQNGKMLFQNLKLAKNSPNYQVNLKIADLGLKAFADKEEKIQKTASAKMVELINANLTTAELQAASNWYTSDSYNKIKEIKISPKLTQILKTPETEASRIFQYYQNYFRENGEYKQVN